MKKELKDYLHLYLGCEIMMTHMGEAIRCEIVTVSEGGCYAKGICKDGKQFNSHGLPTDSKLILRPLSSMTEEEAIRLCEAYSPEAFGDYRFSKWVAKKEPENFCYNVTNEKSDMSFNVDIEKMHIKVYEDGKDTYPSIEDHTYFLEYLKMGFDVLGLIESGLAIDSTTLTQNQ